MKNLITPLLILPLAICCTDESPITEKVETSLSSAISLNENSSIIHKDINYNTFGAPVMFSLLPGLNTTRNSKIKNIKVHGVSLTIDKFECDENKIYGIITWSNINGSAAATMITLQESQSTPLYISPIKPEILENSLLTNGYALIYFNTAISTEPPTFDIRISFNMDIEIEYIKD